MTRRRKRFFVMAVVVVLGLIVIQSTMFVRPRRQITIEVFGTPGQSVVASFDVDGKRHDESKQLPTTFSFRARHVSFTFVAVENSDRSNLAVKAYVGEKHIMSCRDNNGIKGNVTGASLLGLGSNNNGIGGMRPDEFARLP